MLYFGTLLVAQVMVFLIAVVGLRIADLLPPRLRPLGRFYFSPLFGLALFMLLATVHGWLAPFKSWMVLVEAFPLLFLALYLEKRKRILLPYLFTLALFSLVSSTTVLFPLLRFDAYNPFNDTFTYLVHGQWLQQHAFSTPAVPSGHYPALTQVAQYQGAGHRMGASFFLAWVQAAFGLKWSYYAYPAAVSLPLIAGSLAVGGAVQLVVPGQRLISILAAAAMATFFSGFAFGSVYGFFPQTFGLAFAVGGVALLGGLLAQSRRGYDLGKGFLNTLPVALIFAALALCYNDLLPFVVAGTGSFLVLLLIFSPSKMKEVLVPVLILVGETILLINFEFIRILQNFLHTVLGVGSGTHVIGWPVLWSPWEFLAHAFGFKSPVGWWLGHETAIQAALALILVLLLLFLWRFRNGSSHSLYLHLLVVLFLTLGFLYFRYFAKPPSPAETGHTFLQFKVAKWASPFCFVLMGATLAYGYKKFRRGAKIFPAFLLLCVLSAVGSNYRMAGQITDHFLGEVGYNRSAYSGLLHLRELVMNITSDAVIYLDLGAVHHKLRQMIAYVLMDRKLAANYSDDGYILGKLPPDQRVIPFTSAQWVIGYIQGKGGQTLQEPRAGNLILKKRPNYLITLLSVNGGYSRETEGDSWWHWTSHSLEFEYQVSGLLKNIQLRFVYMPATDDRDLQVIIKAKKESKVDIKMKGGWNEFTTPPIPIDDSRVTIRFVSPEKAIRISERDPRFMSFLIRNLELFEASP
jgi:hypothetical protein